MIVEPLNRYVLLKRNTKNVTQGKIILASQNESKNLGVIVKAGPRCENSWQEGQTVQLSSYAGIPVENSEDLFLVQEDSIIAVIKNNEEK